MKKELSRRDFLKAAATGLGALAFGGLLSACSKKDLRCDKERRVKLNVGEYVFVDSWKIKLVSLNSDRMYYAGNPRWAEFAEISIIDQKGIGFGSTSDLIPVGGAVYYDYDQEKRGLLTRQSYISQETMRIVQLTGHLTEEEARKDAEEQHRINIASSRRVIYRCDYNTFAFWNVEDFPESTPTPTMTPVPTPTQTPPPAAVFP